MLLCKCMQTVHNNFSSTDWQHQSLYITSSQAATYFKGHSSRGYQH